MTAIRFVNGRIALPAGVAASATLTIEHGRIAAVGDDARADQVVDLRGGWLSPGFVDTQVNGGGGVLLNDAPTVAGVRAIAEAHRAYGTTALLPTLISDTPEMIAAALDAVDAAIDQGVPGVIGAHIEGPVLNPARKGIHDASRFLDLDGALLELLTRPRRGVVMVTLAPERVPLDTIRALVAAGVRVSVGHSEATDAQMRAAFDAGVTGVTHLFNAMPPMRQREPGVVGATLDDPRPWSGLIVDHVHVAPAVLRIAARSRPLDRLMLVTDAMSSVGAMSKDFVLQGRPISVRDGVCSYADGTLAGSDLDMAQAVANAVADMDLAPEQAFAMASANPAAFLGLAGERGTIAVGAYADLVQLAPDLRCVATWIGGETVCEREAA